jgi:hypothetical protein
MVISCDRSDCSFGNVCRRPSETSMSTHQTTRRQMGIVNFMLRSRYAYGKIL